MTTAELAMWAAVASAVAAIAAVFLAVATIMLSPLGRRVWKILHKRYPKSFTIRVVSVMSRMEELTDARGLWPGRSITTVSMTGLGDHDEVILITKHPWFAIVFDQVLRDHNWEIEMTKLRSKFYPKEIK